MERLLFLTPVCTVAAVITLFPSIILHKQTETDISVFVSLSFLFTVFSPSFQWIQPLFIWDCWVCRVTKGYIWMRCFGLCGVSMCACMQAEKLSISFSMSVHATLAQQILTQRALSCIFVLYWLSEGSMQYFYLWFIPLSLQALWVLFDWALWPLVTKVGSWETIDHCTGNLTQFGRCSVPGRVCLQKTHRILHSLLFTHRHTYTHCPKSAVCSVVSDNSRLNRGGTA